MYRNNNRETYSNYKSLKNEAKRVVARAKSAASEQWYKDLDTNEGKEKVFKIAKARERAKRDVGDATVIKSATGELITNEKEICERWKNYFQTLLNTENEREELPHVNFTEGPERYIEREEVVKAMKAMKTDKAPGPTGMQVESLLALGEEGVSWLTEIFNKIWQAESIPKDWESSSLIPIFKNKGSASECSNYRGIKLFEHAMKVYERIIDRRLRDQIQIDDMQFGFMPGKGTTDPIFVLRQRQEKTLEGNGATFIVFVDLEKAYDRIPREVVFWSLRKKRVTEKLVRVIASLYRGCKTKVICAAGESVNFPIQVGLHQGSALSPFLFTVVLETVTTEVRTGLPEELLYADDLAITADSVEELEARLHQWQTAMEAKGLRINSAKTEVVATSKTNCIEARIRDTHGEEIKQVNSFRYLGTTINQTGSCGEEVKARVQRAWNKWREVSGIVCDKRMPLKLKIKVYTAVIQPVLLYGLEVIPLKRAEERILESTEMRMLRWIGGISLYEHRTNDDIRRWMKVKKITDRAREARLRWYGHVMRREQDNILRKVWFAPVEGRRSRGRQKIRLRDAVARDMRAVGVRDDEWENRANWRRQCRAADPTGVG